MATQEMAMPRGASPFRLRDLPLEDVVFHCKKIDNSRLVREPDPEASGVCWQTIGAVATLAVLLASAKAPSLGHRLYGYRVEALKAEEQRLKDEHRVLELEEAHLLRPERLEEIAHKQKLGTPLPGQVYHLDGKGNAVAMNK